MVAAKLVNAAGVLRGLRTNHARPELAAALAALRELRLRVAGCQAAASLLGLEGAAARAYFGGLAATFVGDIGFAGRERRPPPDPANALLSLGYTLLTNRLAGLVEARGLDPAWGFFHEERPGRPALALDLVEELRHPLVDRFVVRNCNLRVFQARHFEADAERPGGVRSDARGVGAVPEAMGGTRAAAGARGRRGGQRGGGADGAASGAPGGRPARRAGVSAVPDSGVRRPAGESRQHAPRAEEASRGA